jgi:hypothetical protein
MYSTRLLRPCLWTATMVLYWRGAAEHGRPHTFFCTPPRPRTRHKRCAHTKRMSPALQTLQLTPAHCVSSPLHILFHCRHAGTQARRHAGTQSRSHAATHVKTARGRTHARIHARTQAGTQARRHARRHAGTHARRHAGTQARRHAGTHGGTQARRHAGTQARMHAGTQARRQARRQAGTHAGRHARTYARTHVRTQAGRHAGTQARRHTGTQARRHAGTQSRSHAATHVKTARGRTHARANAWTHVRRHHVRTSHGAVRTNSNMNIPARQEQNCGAANANRHRKLGCATADALRRGPGAFKAAQPNSPRYTQRGERYSESRLLQFETDGINGAVLAWCC